MIYVLDTDTLNHYHRENRNALKRVAAAAPASIYVSLPSRIEILQARFEFLRKAADGNQLRRAVHWLHESERLLSGWPLLPLDEAAFVEFDGLRVIKPLKKIGRTDLLIACVALANQATLVTRNVRDFALVPRLRIENWVD